MRYAVGKVFDHLLDLELLVEWLFQLVGFVEDQERLIIASNLEGE